MDIVLLIDLAGSVALLLWGVHMIRTGVQRAFGARLSQVMNSALSNRFKAFMTGMGVTAVLQSSTATGLMITGFAAGGMVDLVPALAVMLGANVGTTLIVQILSFDVSRIAPLFVLIGVVLFRQTNGYARDSGRVFIGLGLLLMALHQFILILQPYTAQPGLKVMMETLSAVPLAVYIIGATLTWLVHSSVAIVLVVSTFAARNIITPETAFALVLSANLGTSINPVIEGNYGKNPTARRLAIGNLLNRAVGSIGLMFLLPTVTHFIMSWSSDVQRAIADFHTLFNLILAVILFPFLPLYARFLTWLMPTPEREKIIDPAEPLYLDRVLLAETPSIAIGNAMRESLRMCDALGMMIKKMRNVLIKKVQIKPGEARRMDNILDRLNIEIRNYLIQIDPEIMSKAELFRLEQILSFCAQLVNAGDVMEKNLLATLLKMNKQRITLSEVQLKPLIFMLKRIRINLSIAAALLMNEDESVARSLAEQKSLFRDIEIKKTADYYRSLREDPHPDPASGTIQLSLIRDLKRANTHIVAAAAYPVLDQKGALLPSRLQPEPTIHSVERKQDDEGEDFQADNILTEHFDDRCDPASMQAMDLNGGVTETRPDTAHKKG